MLTIRTAPTLRSLLFAICLLSSTLWATDCIEVVAGGGGHVFWDAVGDGANAAGRELGVAIVFRGPTDESDFAGQENIVNMIWSLKCRALVVAPNAPERAHAVEQLKAVGIPSVYIDRDTGGANVVAVVATNNYEAGRLAGVEMGKALKGKGRVAILRLKQGVVSTGERERGFIDAAKAEGLELIADPYVGTTAGDARLRADPILTGLKGKIDGLFTPNETTTTGAMVVLKKLGMNGHIIHIGFDANDGLVDALKSGDLQALVLQRPYEMGYQGVLIANRAAHGEPPTNHDVDTGSLYITKADLSRPEVLKILTQGYGLTH